MRASWHTRLLRALWQCSVVVVVRLGWGEQRTPPCRWAVLPQRLFAVAGFFSCGVSEALVKWQASFPVLCQRPLLSGRPLVLEAWQLLRSLVIQALQPVKHARACTHTHMHTLTYACTHTRAHKSTQEHTGAHKSTRIHVRAHTPRAPFRKCAREQQSKRVWAADKRIIMVMAMTSMVLMTVVVVMVTAIIVLMMTLVVMMAMRTVAQSGTPWGPRVSPRPNARVPALPRPTCLAGPAGSGSAARVARLYRYAAALGLDKKHQLVLMRESVSRNKACKNYRCGAACAHGRVGAWEGRRTCRLAHAVGEAGGGYCTWWRTRGTCLQHTPERVHSRTRASTSAFPMHMHACMRVRAVNERTSAGLCCVCARVCERVRPGAPCLCE